MNESFLSDHPQVQCVEKYTAKQSDELSLEKTDVVNITKKTNDGKQYKVTK